MTEILIRALARDREGRPTVLVEDATRVLAFILPDEEAARLGRVLGQGPCGCVPVYDLVAETLERLGGAVQRAVLDGDAHGIVARLELLGAGEPMEIRCHPADALALALRTARPTFATAAAMLHACPREAPTDPDVRRWLERLVPGDFGNRSPRTTGPGSDSRA